MLSRVLSDLRRALRSARRQPAFTAAVIGTLALAGTGRVDTPRVVVINEAMARTLFPGQNAVSRRMKVASEMASQEFEVVGVVGNARINEIVLPAPMTICTPCNQIAPNSPGHGITVPFVADNGTPVEFLQFNHPEAMTWPRAANSSAEAKDGNSLDKEIVLARVRKCQG